MLIHTLLRGASRRRRLCEDSSPRLLTWRQPFFYSTSREADPEVALIKQASIPFSSPWLIPKLNFQRKLVSMKASLNEVSYAYGYVVPSLSFFTGKLNSMK